MKDSSNLKDSAMKLAVRFVCMLSVFMQSMIVYSQGNDIIMDSMTLVQDTVDLSIDYGIDFFDKEEPLLITLRFNIRDFMRTKNKSDYYDAVISAKISDNDSLTQKIRLKARGERRLAYCDFPPIMLNFKSSDPDSGTFQNKGKLKLVTHCNNAAMNETFVLKEYLVYRLYNLVSPYSFKTRLVRINYQDAESENKTFTAYGFLIEDEEKMASRNDAVVLDNMNLTQKAMILDDMLRTAVFQYMIGNTDWAVPSLHNIKVLKSTKIFSAQAIPVPYDFDYSGLVNTNYSAPAPELPIKSVTERYYLGICASKEELSSVLDEFDKLKGPFLETVSSFTLLSPNAQKQVTAYLNSFYKMYNNRNILINTLNSTCKDL